MIDTIINGDCLDIMHSMESESIDCIVTDPPYGMSFMGKDWDKALPSIEIWQECLRVLKPGAFAFMMCIPRQDCLSRMIINLEDAGFMVNFSPILHTFATGFPKAANIGKLIDKRLGAEREVVGRYIPPQDNPKNNWSESNSAYTNVHDTFGIARQDHSPITAPATPEAKDLDGSYAGFQPKPAYEVIIVIMKPLSEKTYLDQALSNGKGISWLGDGRIPYEANARFRFNEPSGQIDYANKMFTKKPGKLGGQSQGRFAPNLLVSDDVLNDGKVRPGSSTGETIGRGTGLKDRYGWATSTVRSRFPDSGSYSRYFSLDQWSDKYLPDSVNRVFPFLIVPKASKSEKNAGLDGLDDREMYYKDGRGNSLEIKCDPEFQASRGRKPPEPRKNHHATVKPIKLGSYLTMIGSRPGDVVLDPFCGSGSFCIASALLDRRYIGIELSVEYCRIAELRIAHTLQTIQDEARVEKDSQLDMFVAAGD